MGVVIHIDKRQLDITHLHARQGFLSEKIQTGFLVLIILKPSEGTNCRFLHTNTYLSKFLRHKINVKTVYTLFLHSKAVCKFSRGHSACFLIYFLIIGLA